LPKIKHFGPPQISGLATPLPFSKVLQSEHSRTFLKSVPENKQLEITFKEGISRMWYANKSKWQSGQIDVY